MMRVKYQATAEILTKQLPMAEIRSLTLSSSATDAVKSGEQTAFTAQTQDKISVREVPLLQPADLTQLPKGQAFALIEGGQLVKLRLPLLAEQDPMLLPGLERIVADMRANYAQYIFAVDRFSAAGTGEASPITKWRSFIPVSEASADGTEDAIEVAPARMPAFDPGLTTEGKGSGF